VLEIRERLAKEDPKNATAQRDLVIGNLSLGRVAEKQLDFRLANSLYTTALEIAQKIMKPEYLREDLIWLESRLKICQATEKAMDDPASALKQPAEIRMQVLSQAISALACQKKPGKVTEAAELLAANAPNAGDVYNAARGYSLCVPLTDKPESKEKYASRAIELLKQAIGKGYKDVGYIKDDSDLDPVRDRDDFKKLLAELEATTAAKETPKEKK